jgi:N-acetylmuramic acid 6-phosphate (MurNAc-6-P) etherase
MYMDMDIKILNDKEFTEDIEMICRQTNYNKEQAIENLKKHNMDVEKVIKTYLGGCKESEEKKSKSVNEMIHSEIRDFFK